MRGRRRPKDGKLVLTRRFMARLSPTAAIRTMPEWGNPDRHIQTSGPCSEVIEALRFLSCGEVRCRQWETSSTASSTLRHCWLNSLFADWEVVQIIIASTEQAYQAYQAYHIVRAVTTLFCSCDARRFTGVGFSAVHQRRLATAVRHRATQRPPIAAPEETSMQACSEHGSARS